MSSPVITILSGQSAPARCSAPRSVRTYGSVPGSNTSGCGAALRPSRRVVESRRRIAGYGERTFDRPSRREQVLRRVRVVLRSPGVVLLSGSLSVLLIGLSPLMLIADQEQLPAVTQSVPSVQGSTGDPVNVD